MTKEEEANEISTLHVCAAQRSAAQRSAALRSVSCWTQEDLDAKYAANLAVSRAKASLRAHMHKGTLIW